MKNKIFLVLFIMLFVCPPSFSSFKEINREKISLILSKIPVVNKIKFNNNLKRPSLKTRKNNYIEIHHLLNEKQLVDFQAIHQDEMQAVRPIALELEAKYLRMDELNEKHCWFYQRKCKKELKKDKAFLTDDIQELRRQIRVKKEYYKILYLNATTREQDMEIRQLIYRKTNGKPQLW